MAIDAVVLSGPTACGKTDLGLQLAESLPCEVISVDSAQVYVGMDIGTAKPDQETRQRLPHHLIDIRDPLDPYSASDFRQDVLRILPEIRERGKIPLLVGGTMLYLRALIKGIADLPTADPGIRAKIVAMAEAEGWPAVHQRLQAVDPTAAARIAANDPQRLQRALEVYEITGKTLTAHHEGEHEPCPFTFRQLAIFPGDRAALHARIEARFDQMLDQGFIAEVESLFKRGDLSAQLPAIKSVGYRQAWSYLAGEIDRDEMRRRAIVATRQLAKRQLTWLRSWPDLTPIDASDLAGVLQILESDRIL